MHHNPDNTINPTMPILSIVLGFLSWLPTLLHINTISKAAAEVLPIVQCVVGILGCIVAALTILSFINKGKDGQG